MQVLPLGWHNFDFIQIFKWNPISILLFWPKNNLQDVADVSVPVKTLHLLKVYKGIFTFQIIMQSIVQSRSPIQSNSRNSCDNIVVIF